MPAMGQNCPIRFIDRRCALRKQALGSSICGPDLRERASPLHLVTEEVRRSRILSPSEASSSSEDRAATQREFCSSDAQPHRRPIAFTSA
jgi:hypothetical protein